MRQLLMLLIFGWFAWLVARSLKSPRQKDEASTPRRKKVESTVIEKKNRSSSDGDKL